MKSWARRLFFILLLLLPTQLGKHFWFSESLVMGRKVDYLSPTFYLSDLLLLLLFLLTLLVPRQSKSQNLGWLPWFLIACVIVVSLVVAPFKLVTAYYGLRLLELVMLVFVVVRLRPTKNMLLVPLSLGVTCEVFLVLAQFLAQRSMGGGWWFLGERTFTSATPGIAQVIVGGKLFLRPYGTFSHPNVLGGFLTVLLPLFFGWQINIRRNMVRWHEGLLWGVRQLVLCMSLVGIALSFSRSAWVVVFVMGVVYVYVRRRVRFFSLVILLFCAVVLEELLLGRLLSLMSFDQSALFERIKLAQAAWKLTLASPLFGLGLGNFIPLVPTVVSPPYLLQPVHSIYLLVLVECGVLGLVLFVGLWLKLLRNTWLQGRVFLSLALAAILALGVNDHYFMTLIQGQLLAALLVGCALTEINSVK